ncbi:polymeric immunoglobulin receptor-like isoform X4 [Pleurodeles waltl]|uniref:polymeric immunoglobulin receptor-like isoform X4 n=1 Tax=Pleurodeles waltl TaxID=8319 RepID=UPI0037095C35
MSTFFLLVVFLKASSALLGPEIVIAERGSSVNITCRYAISRVNIHGRKFWCKMSGTLTGCRTIVSSTPYVAQPSYKVRTRLVDSPADGTFQVEMAELIQKDGGQYRCGIGQSNDGLFFSVFLAVSEGPNMTDHLELVSGELHGSISVRCGFPESQNSKTYWCKMRQTGVCRIIADTEGYMDKRYIGRLLIIPEATGGLVRILINQLTSEDAGWYRCGTGTFRSGGIWKDVQVVISTDISVPEKVNILRTFPGGSVSTECHYDLQMNYEHKYWCKWKGTGCTRLIDDVGFVDATFRGRISLLSEEQKNGTYTLLLTDARAEDAGWYWCVAISGRSILTSSMELQIYNVSTASVFASQMTATSPFASPLSMEEKHFPHYRNTFGTTDTTAKQGSSFMVPASNLPLSFASTPQDYVRHGTRSSLFEVSRETKNEGITQRSSFMVPASNLPVSFASASQDYGKDGTRSPLFEVSRRIITEGIAQIVSGTASEASTSAPVPSATMGWQSMSEHIKWTTAAAKEESVKAVSVSQGEAWTFSAMQDLTTRWQSMLSTAAAEEQFSKESTMRLSTAPTDETRASISTMDSRGRSEGPQNRRSFTRSSNDPERGVSDAHLIESSNYTNVKEGSLKSKRNLLLVLVPSLLLGLVLIAVVLFVITKARCMKQRVRQPVDENKRHIALEETKCLQESAVGDSSNLTGEKETYVDHEEVSKRLMEKVSPDICIEAADDVAL